MNDPYSVLGIMRGADDDTIKKAYRDKCKQYHPDLHPNDPSCEDKFKEVQAAYTAVMQEKSGGPTQSYQRAYSYDSQSSQSSRQYQDPFGFGGFGFDPFGFSGFGASSGYGSSRASAQDSSEMQAANNYIRNGYYQEAMNVLNGISESDRTARWHYYCALANAGLGSNIRAQSEARTAVEMEPSNYEYQQLLSRLQNPGQAYSGYQQSYSQPGSMFRGSCIQLWMYVILCNVCSLCCCGGRGGYYCC